MSRSPIKKEGELINIQRSKATRPEQPLRPAASCDKVRLHRREPRTGMETKTMPMLRRDFLATALAAGAPVVLPGAAEAQGLKRINIVSTAGTTQSVITALMNRMGYFTQLGLQPNVIQVADGSKVVAALISGQADICPTSGFTQVLAAIDKGAPLKILGGGAIKMFYALFSGNPKVRTLKDLEGRTVGIGAVGAQLHQTMIALFHKYGVDGSKVRYVNVGASTDVFKAVAAGTIDAGAAEIWLQRNAPNLHIVEHGRLFDSLPEFINQAAFTSERAIAQKRELIVRTLAAYAKAYRFIMSGNSEGDFIAASAAALGKNDIEAAKDQYRFWRQIQPFAANLGLSESQVGYMQQLNLSTGSQKKLLPYAQLADMSLARDALKLIGG
jgi:ABC-type nitrate/sulfonate/bicarbonate transport system substrate-binding protein